MIERNDLIYTINENDISVKNVYNRFFHIESCILYVVDNEGRLTGIITNGHMYADGEYNSIYINRKYTALLLTEECRVLKEAEDLFKQYPITTAIPVIDKTGKIMYEIRKKREKDTGLLAGFYDKFQKYEKSCYLKQEIINLKEILKNQRIVIIGTEEQFENICMSIIPKTDNVIFIQEIEDAFEYMYHNTNLLIDISVTEYSGRKALYAIHHNGYEWYTFFSTVINMIERECFTRFYRVTKNPIITIKDVLVKYSDKKIYVSSWEILTSPMVEYQYKNHMEIVRRLGIYRKKSVWAYLKRSGIQIKKEVEILSLMETVDAVFLYFKLNKKLRDMIPVLNFVFDTEIQVPKKNPGNIICDQRFDFKNCFSKINDIDVEAPLYTKKTDKSNYLSELELSLKFYMTRRIENDLLVFKDWTSKLVNIENGIRKTCDQPAEYVGTIYFFGMCTIYGLFVEDHYTIPSMIQKYINDSNGKYRVVNLGNQIYSDYRKIRNHLRLEKNDIVMIFFPGITKNIKNQIPVIEIGDDFNKLWAREFPNKSCFVDAVDHCGEYGNIIFSKIIFKELKNKLKSTITEKLIKNTIYDVFRADKTDLEILYSFDSYMKELKKAKKKIPANAEKIGCIVMNANPFTLGHRFLIEYALQRVDYLFLFIVEEDRSEFSFRERYEMVKKGICDKKNVSLIRSGKLIISFDTFPTYFMKAENVDQGNACINTDLRVFAQYIAPVLGIKYRFIGEEPTDHVTQQYNTAMKKILPAVSEIHVVEVPRQCINGTIISASTVRKYYAQRDFRNLSNLIPETTLAFLTERVKRVR